MMRQTDPENINLPYMLQSLAAWIMRGEKQNRNESRLAEAERLIREARLLFVHYYGENHVATVTADLSLSMLALTRGDLARAESMREELLRRHRQASEGDYNYIWSLFYLAEVKLALGKGAEAETLFGQASELGRRQWGANDPRFERLVRDINQARTAASIGERGRGKDAGSVRRGDERRMSVIPASPRHRVPVSLSPFPLLPLFPSENRRASIWHVGNCQSDWECRPLPPYLSLTLK